MNKATKIKGRTISIFCSLPFQQQLLIECIGPFFRGWYEEGEEKPLCYFYRTIESPSLLTVVLIDEDERMIDQFMDQLISEIEKNGELIKVQINRNEQIQVPPYAFIESMEEGLAGNTFDQLSFYSSITILEVLEESKGNIEKKSIMTTDIMLLTALFFEIDSAKLSEFFREYLLHIKKEPYILKSNEDIIPRLTNPNALTRINSLRAIASQRGETSSIYRRWVTYLAYFEERFKQMTEVELKKWIWEIIFQNNRRLGLTVDQELVILQRLQRVFQILN